MLYCSNCRVKFPREELQEIYCFKHKKKELFCDMCAIEIEFNGGDEHSFVGE